MYGWQLIGFLKEFTLFQRNVCMHYSLSMYNMILIIEKLEVKKWILLIVFLKYKY